MAFINVSTFSMSLGKSMQYNAFVPDGGQTDIPVFLLMHGLSDDYTQWQRFTETERFAAERGVAVIMPDGARSFYTDMKFGGAYYSCMIKDVMESARNLFPISRRRERTFTAGLSMGGYGAAKIALRNPDMFAGFIALSGLAVASIVGILLNAILPGKRDEYMPNQENSSSLGKF